MREWIISASVLIVMVMLCRRLFRGRLACWVQYSLWLLVAVRLLVPVSPFKSTLSVANLLPESWTGQQAEISVNDSAEAAYPAAPEQGGVYRQESARNMPAVDTAAPAAPKYSQAADSGAFVPEGGEPTENKREPWRIIGAVWLAGACLLAMWLVGVNGLFRYRVSRNCLPFKAPEKRQGGLPVYVTGEISTPCMYGLLRPAIYITPRAAEDPQVLAMVLCHEQTHYRHGDHIWSVVRMLCLCVHWYNPLVWAAVSLSRQDGELACDEGVLRQLGEGSRRRYGEALLTLSTRQGPSLRSCLNLATSMSDTKKQLKKRLSALVTAPRMAAGTAALAVILSVGLIVCTFTSRAGEENPATDGAGMWKRAAAAGRYNADGGDKDSQDVESDFPGGGQLQDAPAETPDAPWQPWIVSTEYTGYLDECGTEEEAYRNQDYDGDGLIDRIYQDVASEPGVMRMRVEFGNGEVLAFDTYENSLLVVQSMDLDGDGSRELLFTKPNEFSTNPMAIATDILLFTRGEDGYRQVDTALEQLPEDDTRNMPTATYLLISGSMVDDSSIRVNWSVPGGEGEMTHEHLRSLDEKQAQDYKENTTMAEHYTAAYRAELMQDSYAFLRLYFESLDRAGDKILVDLALEDGRLLPVNTTYEEWWEESVSPQPEVTGAVYDGWDVELLEYYNEEHMPVAEVTAGETTLKLTYVETFWSLSVAELQFSREILYWACQALQELEEWTGTEITEAYYSVSEFGDFNFAQTASDLRHDRIYYNRCYSSVEGLYNEGIECLNYSTDMDVWYSPVKQYTTPPGYDRMSAGELLTWYFERSAIARGARVEEIIHPWQGDYVIRTDQGTYYEFFATDDIGTVGRGMSLYGPYDDYPVH